MVFLKIVEVYFQSLPLPTTCFSVEELGLSILLRNWPGPDEPEGEPVEDLDKGDDAEPHEEAEEAPDLRYEVQQGHPGLKLILEKNC